MLTFMLSFTFGWCKCANIYSIRCECIRIFFIRYECPVSSLSFSMNVPHVCLVSVNVPHHFFHSVWMPRAFHYAISPIFADVGVKVPCVRRTLRSVHEDLELHETRVRVPRHPVRNHPRERDERPRLRSQVADVLREKYKQSLRHEFTEILRR